MTERSFNVPLVIRGKTIEGDDVSHGGRGGGVEFTTPDVARHLDQLVLPNPRHMAQLYTLSVAEILDYLGELGQRLSPRRNPWTQEAFELSCRTSGLSRDILAYMYENMDQQLDPATLREAAQNSIGIDYLDGWVEMPLQGPVDARVRAFGARTVHIAPGNAPGASLLTIARNAITRGDAIIKAPSNDPCTAAAIARTMIEMAPDHPLTRHVSVAYWKGGNAAVEEKIYSPRNIEKIVAWGGMASIKHIARYIQPGIELVALDPKLSSTIIGQEAFADEDTMREVASALAMDGGGLNQEGCVNARVVWVHSGIDPAGIAQLERFGTMVYDAIQALPPAISGPAVRLDPQLADELEALSIGGDEWYTLIGGGPEGAVIVSRIDEPVDFAPLLTNRVLNLVPIDDVETAVQAVTTYTQTIGIWPDKLKVALRDSLALHGAQRVVTLGHAIGMPAHGIQDAIEPWRRMCRWIVEETSRSTIRS